MPPVALWRAANGETLRQYRYSRNFRLHDADPIYNDMRSPPAYCTCDFILLPVALYLKFTTWYSIFALCSKRQRHNFCVTLVCVVHSKAPKEGSKMRLALSLEMGGGRELPPLPCFVGLSGTEETGLGALAPALLPPWALGPP